MTDLSETLHEERSALKPETIDRHRAIASIREELEAIDWYDQRVEAATDPELRDVLAHNRDEEKEHAAMVLEWLRRHDPVLDEMLREYLFTDTPIVKIEEEKDENGDGQRSGDGSLGIGSLRGAASDG